MLSLRSACFSVCCSLLLAVSAKAEEVGPLFKALSAAGPNGAGEILWRLRPDGSFWATPVLVGNHLFCVNHDGLVQVVRVSDQGEVIACNDFGESIGASPAVADGALYFRSDGHLWKIAGP